MAATTSPISLRLQLKLALQESAAAAASAASASTPSPPPPAPPARSSARKHMHTKLPRTSSTSRSGAKTSGGGALGEEVEPEDEVLARQLLENVAKYSRPPCVLHRAGGSDDAQAGDEEVPPSEDDLEAVMMVPDDDDASVDVDKFLRRSTRCPGAEQLSRPDVKALLSKLASNSSELAVLRLKNFLLADTNALVLRKVFKLLHDASNVQALYVQSFDQSMDDELLGELIKALQANKSIWALNVGENIRVTRKGWENFANALPTTHVTHLYAGSESTVHGALKVVMRDRIRANRSKHNLHISLDNLEVIRQIGQMWWNPRNAAAVRNAIAQLDDIKPGLRLAFKSGPASSWNVARVVRVARDPPRLALVVHERTKQVVEWVDLDDPKKSATTVSKVVWALVPGSREWWPATLFSEVDLVAPLNLNSHVLALSAVKVKEWSKGCLEGLENASSGDFSFERAKRMAEYDLDLTVSLT